jgi:Fe-S oxidoreductase
VGAEAIVATCPWCKENFARVAAQNGEDLKIYDISELILASIEG